MKDPLLFAGTVLEFDMVLRIFEKEFSEFYGNCYWVDLIWVSRRVKDLSCDMEEVSNDYNMLDIGVGDYLVNTTSDSKELGLSYGYIDCPM